ncbi:hypothetical protein CA267_006655 [Alteromonas pelagimontana]|uniref:Uncharacterized protein n=2 Tax=Alteromonas pelagimontana TaxID=1858656 RepID=A0A6M4MIA0_9ALTE|nr:hypothetical protein CA267_006655 [Alteromonas pelagimontana]
MTLEKGPFLRVAVFTFAILSVPLIAMQFTDEVNWDIADFIVMACLLFGMGSLFILVSRSVSREHRYLTAIIFTLLSFYIWAELSVGVFTSLGS